MAKRKIGFSLEEQRIAERYAIRFGLHSVRLVLKRRRDARFVYLIGTDEDGIEYRIRFDKVKRMRKFSGSHQITDPVEYFTVRAKKVHGDDYDYSLVTAEDLAHRGKVAIGCNRDESHGIFRQDSGNHINHGKGCPKCGRKRLRNLNKINGNRKKS